MQVVKLLRDAYNRVKALLKKVSFTFDFDSGSTLFPVSKKSKQNQSTTISHHSFQVQL